MPRGRKDIKNDAVKFSKEYQPSPEAKSRGARKRGMRNEIARALAKGDFKKMAETMAKLYDIPEDQITHIDLAFMRILEKAIRKGDVRAFEAVMDRLEGKAQQTINVVPDIEVIQVKAKDED